MTFIVPAETYDRLMGRYLPTLAPAFVDAAGIGQNTNVLDVGCGPGGLTRELVARVGADAVAAIDLSPTFVAACRERNPGVDVREGVAEDLPFEDGSFDATLASLVVGFMRDAEAGAREMARVTRRGGVVAACYWDHTGMPSLNMFWKTAASLELPATDQTKRLGSSAGELAVLLKGAGLTDVDDGEIVASAEYASFEDWWDPYTLGVGPAGAYYQALDTDQREALRLACERALGHPGRPFTQHARAWFARGRV